MASPTSSKQAAGSSIPASRRSGRLIEHPGRVATVVITLAVVITLGVVLLSSADTDTPSERRYPAAIDGVSPGPGELIRLQDTITADLRNDLTGVLVINGVDAPSIGEIPEDQLERVVPLGQLSFRPGPDQEVERFEPGEYIATVLYWPQRKERPAQPGSFSWRFRAGA
jgi:hypothetical protein